jgi:acyl carrier protein
MMTDTAEEFVSKLELEFDDFEPGTITPETKYREMEEWSSMHALIVIAFINAEYNVTLGGEDLRNTETLLDIYNITKSKLN